MPFDRKIQAVAPKRDVVEGAGEIVGRVLPQGRLGLEPLDPFLMLDHFKMSPGGPGFPEHPHRGFEILTYVLTGWAAHEDNLGNKARVEAGGLMRLTAGSGLWHGETGGAESGTKMEGLQFWVNLASAKKKIKPSFQHVDDAKFPRQTQDGGNTVVKVLVGPESPVTMHTPMVYLHVTVQSAGRFRWELPKEHQGFIYIIEGNALFPTDEAQAAEGHVAVLGEGGGVELINNHKGQLSFVLAAGHPHRQPVLWNGPFVD